MSIEETVAKLLIQKNKTLTIAESCTGGLVSHRLTNISGSSKFLKISVVVYSNQSKIQLLKVPSLLIKKYGAVSEQVAKTMTMGARKILKTDFGLSITGIAGPTGATKDKPVGLTFIAVASARGIICKKFIFKGSRLKIKSAAATAALKLLRSFVV